jgi:D-tyrosyl-tRNA(Tyr) deacylase
MRACIQRVGKARVTVAGQVCGQIAEGLLVLLGVGEEDTEEDIHWMAKKIVHLRIFPDAVGQMNRSVLEVDGQLLIVSQFTLYGNCRKGRRPSFVEAATPEQAEAYYDRLVTLAVAEGASVATGKFRAEMEVELINTGPVTIWIDSKSDR